MNINLRIILSFVFSIGTLLSSAQSNALKDSLDLGLERAISLRNNNPDKAVEEATKILEIAKAKGIKETQASAHRFLSRWEAEKGAYTLAIEYALEALNIFQELQDKRSICTMYIHLGVIYRYNHSNDQSLEYYQRAEALAMEENFEDLKAAIWGNMGNVYYRMDENDQALEYHLKSLAIDEAANNTQGIGNTYHNIGMVYKAKKYYEQALDYYRRSLEIDLEEGNQRNIGISYLDFAEIYLQMGEYRDALEFTNKAIEISEEINSLRIKESALKYFPLIYASLGNSNQAFEAFLEHRALADSLQNETISRQIAEMEAQYKTDQQDKELALQELRIENQQNAIKQQWFFIAGLIAFFLLLAILSYLIFNRYRLKQSNRQLQLENEQFKLSKNLKERKDIDDTINYFATSLYGKNTVEDILWDVAKNCISNLGLVDCVIYMVDEERNVLVQKAAYGVKNPDGYIINEPMEIPFGQGIVGTVAKTGQAEIINDTSKDPRYIVDEEARLSELAVPLIQQEKLIGVIDSEHPEKGFFKEHHLEALKTIAAICTSKIAQAQADEEVQKAQLAQIEAEHLKQMDQLKSQFFTNISHEFRTPLNLILAPLQSNRDIIPAEEVDMMRRNAKRLLRLVNQLLDLAKIEVGLMKLENRNVEVSSYISEIAHSFSLLAEAKNIQYQVDIPERDFVMETDPDKLEKIIYNLLSNGFKFTPDGGKVSIHLSMEPNKQLRIAVSDTGIGIADEFKEKIFERFYQADPSQTRAYEGTGIGLALTKELVELLGGTISLDSQKDKGSTFIIYLPVSSASSAHLDIQEGIPKESRDTESYYPEFLPQESKSNITKGKVADNAPLIIIVEDNNDLRTYVNAQLSQNFNVIEAPNGKKGLELAQETIPDLIITDIMMPEMDGVHMTQLLRKDDKTSHIPIILLTARDDGETKIKGFETGAEQYLVKPFEIDELIARINSLLLQRNRLQQKFSQEVRLQPQEVVINHPDASFLENLVQIVEENIENEAFTVEFLQKNIGMSRMQLHRKLKALTNQSASEFIRSIKLKRAAQILTQPGMQVTEAAYQSGFNHLSYFAKCFKEQFGISPSEYAEKNAGER